MSYLIKVAARDSALSKAQVQEVLKEWQHIFPSVQFETTYVKTRGDKDKKTSLRTLGKSDFFTYEIDEMVKRGECDIGIHSAKDLPDPLPEGLALIALTKGVDPSDSLVMREGEREPQIIATSSQRREENVKKLFPHARFVDIRGTIEERLEELYTKRVDGVVIAEAALIRLNRNDFRIRLPGETAPLQGRLAIMGRKDSDLLAISCTRFLQEAF